MASELEFWSSWQKYIKPTDTVKLRNSRTEGGAVFLTSADRQSANDKMKYTVNKWASDQ